MIFAILKNEAIIVILVNHKNTPNERIKICELEQAMMYISLWKEEI